MTAVQALDQTTRHLNSIYNKTTANLFCNMQAGEGNRTLVFSLEGCCSTTELHPQNQLTQPPSRKKTPAFATYQVVATHRSNQPNEHDD